MRYPRLFEPFVVRGTTLRNRVAMAPMSTALARPDGSVTPAQVAYLRARAAGGVGLVVVEFTSVDRRHGLAEACQLTLETDAHVAGHAELVRAIRAEGATACLQLQMAGRHVEHGPVDGALPVAPSDVHDRDGTLVARAMTDRDVLDAIDAFRMAARRAVAAGYAAIELHGAHGYLLMAFSSPRQNRRDDRWGGSDAGRLAFPRAVIEAVRAELGPERPLLYRLSEAEHAPGGLTLDDTERIAPQLVAAGVDLLDVSSGSLDGGFHQIVDPMSSPLGWRFDAARRLRRAANVPVMVVGPVRWPGDAEAALARGDCDLIALGRPLLADPEWARKAAAGADRSIRPCTNCNWCMDRTRRHLSVGCAENPTTGNELEAPLQAALGRGLTAVVVGAGPGGLHAALELATAGFETHLLEARERLGGGLIASTAPPMKDKLAWYLDYLEARIEDSAVRVHRGTRADAATILRWRPSIAVVAAGATPGPTPIGRIDSDRVVDAHEVLMRPLQADLVRDRDVVVYGGGETGCETAELLAMHGARVTLVTRSPATRLARNAEVGYRKSLRRRLSENPAVTVLERTRIESIDGARVQLVDEAGDRRELSADRVFVAQGRRHDPSLVDALRAAGVVAAAVGDARQVARIGDAVHDAHRAVRALIAERNDRPGDHRPVSAPDAPRTETCR